MPRAVGIVVAQDLASGRVRVKFPDRDQMQSWWLGVLTPKTQSDKHYLLPDIGEQVTCLMDEHFEDGDVLGARFNAVDSTPVQSADKWHVTVKDGATFEYDRAAHTLAISLPPGAAMTIQANGAEIQIDSSGNVNANAGAGAALTASANGAQMQIDSSGDVNIAAGGGKKINLAGGAAAVARIGDTVHVTDDEGGTLVGTIVSGSTISFSG